MIAIIALMLVVTTAQAQPLPTKYDAEIIEIEKQGVRRAYQDVVVLLFLSWMRDEHGQPERALAGIRRARQGYIAAMTAIEARERK